MLAAVDDIVGAQAQPLAVAVSLGEDVAVGVGVVGRNGSVEVEAKDFAVVVVVVLRADTAVSEVSRAHEQCVVGQDQQAASVVDACGTDGMQDFFVAQRRTVPIEHAQALLVAKRRVREVDFGRGVPLRVKGHAQQAGFNATVVDVEAEDRFVGARQRVDVENVAFARGAPQHVVRAPCEFPRNVDA